MAYTNRFPTGSYEYEGADLARSSLNASINDSALSIQLVDDDALDAYANFPSGVPSNEPPFMITMENEQTLIYSRSGNILTVWDYDTHGAYGTITGAGETGRGYAGTSASDHTIPSGGSIVAYLNITKTLIKENQNAIALKADDSAVVHLTGNETIAGIKTFANDSARSTTNGAPTNELSFTNRKYVDDSVSASGAISRLTSQTIDGGVSVNDPVYLLSGTWYKAIKGTVPTGVNTDTNEVTTFGLKTGLSGLTQDAEYYLDDTGGLSTNYSEYKIGKAHSTTSLFVKIQPRFQRFPDRNYLIAEYLFDLDDAVDTSNSRLDVTMANDTYQAGINLGKELILNGTNTGGASSTFNFLKKQELSVSLWITADDPTHATDDVYTVGYCQVGNDRSGWQVQQTNSLLKFTSYSTLGAPLGTILSTAYTSTSRHHVVITCDDSVYKMYVDGVEVDSQSQPTFEFSANMEIQIGKRDAVPSGMAGKLDNIRIYEKVLSLEEVKMLYNEV